MNEYNFWRDLLDTFQSSTDWIKALWLIIPPLFLLALFRMAMRFRLSRLKAIQKPVSVPIYPARTDDTDEILVFNRGLMVEKIRAPRRLLVRDPEHQAAETSEDRPDAST